MEQPELISAGFVLVRPAKTPPYERAVLPEMITTISDCLMDDLPRPEFWDWFTDADEAAAASRTDGAAASEIVTVAFVQADATAFMEEVGGSDHPCFELLRADQPMAAYAEVIGYEVVGAEQTLDFHSWHCHTYAADVREQLGVACNDLGLIPTYDDATTVLRWMLDRPADEQPAPVPWVVVALVRQSD